MESTVEQLKSLEQKLISKEQKNVQEVQKEILLGLIELRQTFVSEVKSLGNVKKFSDTVAEEDPKDLQIKELKSENARLQYRINHLVKNLKERL